LLGGQPIAHARVYGHHDGYGPHGQPAHRREALPDRYLLAGLEQQILDFLDHLEAAAPGRWVSHILRVGGHGREYRWLCSLVRTAHDSGKGSQHLPWTLRRGAIACALIGHVLGIPKNRVRRKLDVWDAEGGLEGFRRRGGLG
jgi:hypothetical protein